MEVDTTDGDSGVRTEEVEKGQVYTWKDLVSNGKK